MHRDMFRLRNAKDQSKSHSNGKSVEGSSSAASPSSARGHEGSQPTDKPTGVDGDRKPFYVQEVLSGESREAYLQRYIQNYMSRGKDLNYGELADKLSNDLLALRKIRGNEITDQKIKDLDIHRKHIVKALSNFVKNQYDALSKDEKREFEKLMKIFKKHTIESTKSIGFNTEKRNSSLEAIIKIAKLFDSSKDIFPWLKEGCETWMREGREASEREMNQYIGTVYSAMPLDSDARNVIAAGWRNRSERYLTAAWESQGRMDRLANWIAYGQWYYPVLLEWRQEQAENIVTRDGHMNEQIANVSRQSGEISTLQSEKIPTLYDPYTQQKMLELDIMQIVYNRQNTYMQRVYDRQMRKKAKEASIEKSEIVQQTKEILQLHSGQRQNLIDEGLKIRNKQKTSGPRIDPKIKGRVIERIDQMIQEYMRNK